MFAPLFPLQFILGIHSLCPAASLPCSNTGDDAELVAASLNGSHSAQSTLYRKYSPLILRRATRMLARKCDAEDVLQDSFVEAFRDLHQLRAPADFGHWLMRISTHQIHKRFRKRKLLARLGLDAADDASLAQLIEPSASPELVTQCSQLDKALRTLTPKERIVWSLRLIEGCRMAEIVSLTNSSLATVKRRFTRAHKQVQLHFSDKLPSVPEKQAKSLHSPLSPHTIQEETSL